MEPISQYKQDAAYYHAIYVPDIPEAYRNALTAIQAMFPEAVLGGGCLRDLVLGRPGFVKDLDIVIDSSIRTIGEIEEAINDFIEEVLAPASKWEDGAASWRAIVGEQDLEKYGLLMPDVKAVWEIKVPALGPWPLQIIAVNQGKRPFSLLSVAERPDFGICRIAYDGKQLCITTDFLLDAAYRRFTLLRSTAIIAHANRWVRLQSKYPGWAPALSVTCGASADDQLLFWRIIAEAVCGPGYKPADWDAYLVHARQLRLFLPADAVDTALSDTALSIDENPF